jgi:hypothetical protein
MEDKLIRIQFEMPEEKVKEIEDMMAEAGVKTRRDFFNNALSLLAWAIRERQTGRTIASMDESEQRYKELYMPILENAVRPRVKV